MPDFDTQTVATLFEVDVLYFVTEINVRRINKSASERAWTDIERHADRALRDVVLSCAVFSVSTLALCAVSASGLMMKRLKIRFV